MPELPEVENVRRSLWPLIANKQITAIDTNWPKIMVNGLQAFRDQLIGQRFIGLDRRGKYLLFRFDNGETMISHLRMEGKYQVVPDAAEPLGRFAHVWFTFSDGSQLRYHDMRKFGRMVLGPTGLEATVVPTLAKLGPEPTPEDFAETAFAAKLAEHKTAIKSVLLDQRIVAGVGNIYADEVLWLSQLNPEQPACTLKKSEIHTLHDAIIDTLQRSITLGGTSVHTFVDASGKRGGYQHELHVYDREGTPCDRCGTTIKKIKVGERGTHFCPHCQPLRKRVIR